MADTKVSNLVPITVPSDNDVLYIVKSSSGTSNKISFGNLLKGVNDTITTLNTNVNLFTSEVKLLSTFYESLNLSNVLTDVALLSVSVRTLSTETDDLYAIRGYATTAYTKVTVLTGGLTRSVTTAGGTLNFINGVLQSVT